MLSLLHPFYRNPFYLAHTETGRVDMGVDYHGVGTICAIGRARIVGDGGKGWPGGHYLCYELLLGRHRGRYVYVAEGVLPIVKPGQVVKKGQAIAHFNGNAAPGQYPGIETGWSSDNGTLNETLAAQMGQLGGKDHADSPAGQAFARFLHRIGAPAPQVPPGPEYPKPLL